jgi:hypothetical protein
MGCRVMAGSLSLLQNGFPFRELRQTKGRDIPLSAPVDNIGSTRIFNQFERMFHVEHLLLNDCLSAEPSSSAFRLIDSHYCA